MLSSFFHSTVWYHVKDFYWTFNVFPCLIPRAPIRTGPWLSYWSYVRAWLTCRPWCPCSPAAWRTPPSRSTSATWLWFYSRWRRARFKSATGESCHRLPLIFTHQLPRLLTSLIPFPPLQVTLQHLLCASSDGERALFHQLREQVWSKIPVGCRTAFMQPSA